MRYRQLTADGDYKFGNGRGDFLVDNPQAVAQAVYTRLRLWSGQWFLDVEEGTPYETQVLGTNTQALYDTAIRKRILETEGVNGLVKYNSTILNRQLSVECAIDTVFGPIPLSVSAPFTILPPRPTPPTILETEGGDWLTTEDGSIITTE